MEVLVSKLCRVLFYPFTPSADFLASLTRYTTPIPAVTIPIETLLQARSPEAFALYSRLVASGSVRNMIYVFLVLSSDKKNISSSIMIHLKRCALGFQVPLINPSEIILLKSTLAPHKYNLVYRMYLNSLNYRRLRQAIQNPCSITHKYFLEMLRPILKEYEKKVAFSPDTDILLFHNSMYEMYMVLSDVININDTICSRKHFKNPLMYEYSAERLFHGFLPEKAYVKVLYRFANECTRQYFTTGSFNDPYDEYFIKEHKVVSSNVLYGISEEVAEQIAYVGRYTCLLRSIQSFELSAEVLSMINSLDLASRAVRNKINALLTNINRLLHKNFIEKYQIVPLLEYIHDVFLFRRGDFIERFFTSLKETRRASRVSLLSILEDSLCSSFPASPFNSVIDLFVKRTRADANSTNATEREEQSNSFADGFSLFCHLEYPVSVVVDEEFVLKLACIFKFLWKLKKVDMLCRRVKNIHYLNLAQKLLFYMFYEVLGGFSNVEWNESGMAMEEFTSSLNNKLCSIMKRLFINAPGKKIEFLLFHMEKAMLAAGKTGVLDDTEIQKALREFCAFAAGDLCNTALNDIHIFVRM